MPGVHEGADEGVLELGRQVAVDRLGDALRGEVEQPARADDRHVRRVAAGDVGGQPLQQRVPRHDLDVDVDVGVRGLEVVGDLLEIGAGLGAVFGDGEIDDGLGRGRPGKAEAKPEGHERPMES